MTYRPWFSLLLGALLTGWLAPSPAHAQSAATHSTMRAGSSTLRELAAVRRFLHAELLAARAKDDTRRALHLKVRLRQVDAAIAAAQQQRHQQRARTRAQKVGRARSSPSRTVVIVRRGHGLDPAAQGATMVRDMAATRERIARRLRHAQRRRDAALAGCLYGPLQQASANLAQARGRLDALGAATVRGQRDLADHEITILTVLDRRVTRASEQARRCTSLDEIGTPGELSVRTTIDYTSPAD